MAMPAADDRARTVKNVVSARYGRIETHAFPSAAATSDHVLADAPAGPAPAIAAATTLLAATVPSVTTRPSPVRSVSVSSFAVRYGQRPVPLASTERSVPEP